jgi:UDP-glucose 4-epimerase
MTVWYQTRSHRRRYLVTGGCGFIGSHLVNALVAGGHEVRVLDDLSTAAREDLPTGAELLVADVVDPHAISMATQGIDGCFHLAAVASVARCNESWLDSHRTNLSATIALFDAASSADGRFPVVYASSAAVYGDQPGAGPLREDMPVRPNSPYGADKAACELHARAGMLVRGLATIGLRFFNVYGPRQRADSPYSGVIAAFADRVRRSEPLTIHGDGHQTRDFVFVGDVVRALTGAMRRLEATDGRPAGEVFNVCSGRSTSILELAQLLMALNRVSLPIIRATSRDGDIRSSIGSPDALTRAMGVRSEVGLDDGLSRTLDFRTPGPVLLT